MNAEGAAGTDTAVDAGATTTATTPTGTTAAADTSTTTTAASTTTDTATAADDDWDGTVATLDKRAWWNEVPEAVRPKLRGGLERRDVASGAGVRQKVEASNAEVKAAKAEVETARRELDQAKRNAQLYQDLLGGNEDPRVAEAAAALEAAKAEHARALGEATGRVKSIETERDGYKARLDALRTEEAGRQAQTIAASHAEIVADDTAYAHFERLITATDAKGEPLYDVDEAAALTHAKFPALKPQRVDRDVEITSPGDGPLGVDTDQGGDFHAKLMRAATRAEHVVRGRTRT